jgi:hypothetical protein
MFSSVYFQFSKGPLQQASHPFLQAYALAPPLLLETKNYNTGRPFFFKYSKLNFQEKMKKAEKVASGVNEEKVKKPKMGKKEAGRGNQKRRGAKNQEDQVVDLEAQRKAIQEQKMEEKKVCLT